MAATGKESVSLSQFKIAFDEIRGDISSKLQVDDLVAGANITIDKTSQPGKAVIIGTGSAQPVVYTAGEGLALSGQEFSIADGGVTADKIADGVIPEIALATDAEAKGFLGY